MMREESGIDDKWPVILQRRKFVDDRGSLERLYETDTYSDLGFDVPVAHINITRTVHSGTVKGFHLQISPYAEIKLISCIAGRILDVAVDLRPGSKTFGGHYAFELSSDSPASVLIPQGFAHGMQALEDESLVHYVHSAPYAPLSEAGLYPLDPDLGIQWPMPPVHLSLRDQNLPRLSEWLEIRS